MPEKRDRDSAGWRGKKGVFARLCAWIYNTTQTAAWWAWCPRGYVCKEMDSMCVFLCVARERAVCVSLCVEFSYVSL